MSKKDMSDKDLEGVSGGAVDLEQNTGTTALSGRDESTMGGSTTGGGGSGSASEIQENTDPTSPISGAV